MLKNTLFYYGVASRVSILLLADKALVWTKWRNSVVILRKLYYNDEWQLVKKGNGQNDNLDEDKKRTKEPNKVLSIGFDT